MKEIRVLAERWRIHYNTVRPHSSLGYRPPAPEAWLINKRGACKSGKPTSRQTRSFGRWPYGRLSRHHPIHGKAFPTLIERLERYIFCLPGRSKGQRLSRNGLNPVGGIASPRDESRHV